MGTTSIDVADIKWLRDETGAGIMDAKRALQDADGDRDKARKLLEQRGVARAEKVAGREAGQGIVDAYIHAGGQVGVLVELDSNTDFVARMPEFKQLAHEIAMQIAANDPKYVTMDEIPEAEAVETRERLRQEALAEGKPEKLVDEIVAGRFRKLAERDVLLEQPYIRDDSKTIRQLVQELSAKTGENIVIRRFSRFRIGA
jgi:elongation factor Ts